MAEWIEYVEQNSGEWQLEEYSAGWFGVIFALSADLISQGLTYALRSTSLLDPESPDDALPPLGSERRMGRYPAESASAYRARLHGAWEAYRYAGSAFAIEQQLVAAGFSDGVYVAYYPTREGPLGQPAPYWSQFWLVFPGGTHGITSEGAPWDSFAWDDGTRWGPVGMSDATLATLRGIVRKWKAVQWICRGFVIEIPGAAWDAFFWDDGTVWAGQFEVEF